MTENKSYDIEDIKKAFWSTFGEKLCGDPEGVCTISHGRFNDSELEGYWVEFFEYLKARIK